MKRFFFICIILAFANVSSAGDNPNKAAAPQSAVPAEKISRIKLENRRVQNVNGDTFTYDTGKKIITVKADSPASRQFIKDVQSGRKAAAAGVTLTPQRKSPFNTEYKAR